MPNPENLIGKGFAEHPENIYMGGRPKGISVTTHLRELLDKITPEAISSSKVFKEYLTSEGGLTNAQAMAVVLIYKAINRQDLKAITEILDRTEGKPQQLIEHSGAITKIEVCKTIISKK